MRRPPNAPLLVLALALVLLACATWLEGKTLWVAYNLVGATATLAAWGLLARLRLDLPPLAGAICFLTAMLHYVGGSLGGHFGIEGVNGLYALFPWWDRMTHFFGATGVALLAHGLLSGAARRGGWRVPHAFGGLFAFAFALSVGVGVELFEFAGWTLFGTIDQGFYSNTMMDLYDDATGALFGAALAVGVARAKAGAQAPGAAGTGEL